MLPLFKKLRIIPIAAESFGVRSMATFVETPSFRILIDPGAAIAPKRYGLPPHPLEKQALIDLTHEILEYAKKSDALVISHYHHDHFKPPFTENFTIYTNKTICNELYRDKILFVKDFTRFINKNGKKRANILCNFVKNKCKHQIVADGTEFTYGECKITFSPPFFHGEQNSTRGYVIMTKISVGDEIFLHTSDVQGPMVQDTADYIQASGARLAYIGGPPSYLENKISAKDLKLVKSLMDQISSQIPFLIYDHHLLRDLNYKLKFADLFKKKTKNEKQVMTASEFMGKEPKLLEARRKILFEQEKI